MSFSYANPTSGPSAGGIGWFNFGTLTLNPGDSITGLTGTLNNGINVTFDLSMSLISGQARPFVAHPTPTFPGASFGVNEYTGIVGNVALWSNFAANPAISSFTFSNITLTNPDSTPVTNYTMVFGDAEQTGAAEGFQLITNGGGWQRLIGSPPPILTGLGTQIATITGSGLVNSSAYVLNTQSPTQLTVNVTEGFNGREAFVIGFATSRIRLQKNVSYRINPSDQFVLDIGGTPFNQVTTTGSSTGIQTIMADIFATPLNNYTINESMAPGSISTLQDYTQIVSASNSTPAGTIPPTGNLPITFTPAVGDDVIYTILNAAPETFTKMVDKAYANIGEVLTYTVIVNNPNNFAVSNVLVSDATPNGTTYIGNLTVSSAYTGTDLPTGITITTIPASGIVTITWQVQVNSLPPVSNPIPNFAHVKVPGGSSGVTNVVTTQVNTAFVTLNKLVNKTFVKTGDTITYTIMLHNAGNVPANNVVVSDVIPLGTTFVPGSLIGATGTPPTFALLGSIAAGGDATMSFQVLVDNNIPSQNPITNSSNAHYTFTVDPANPNGASGTAQSNTVSTQINEAIVTMAKNVNTVFANISDTLTYTILLINNGNIDANNVIITDAVPTGTTFVPGSVVGASGTPPTLTLTNPIPAGGSTTVSFQVLVDNTIPNPSLVVNEATSTFQYTMDPENPNGETGTSASNAVSTQINHANIITIKSVDKNFADTEDILTYTLQLQNTGNVIANNIVIDDILPAGTTFILGSLLGATGTPPTLAVSTPLAPSASTVVSFQVKVGDTIPQPNPLDNHATTSFTYTVNPAQPDGATGNQGSNTVSTQINHAKIISRKTVDKAYADVSDILTYTITLQNVGNVVASNVTLNDVIPVGTTYVVNSLTGATGTLPNITLNVPIGAGVSATVTFQVKVTSLPPINPLENVVVVQYKYTVDPVLPNAVSATTASTIAVTQVNHANLDIEKSADKFVSFLGDTITYQLVLTNTGNVPATNVVITDSIVDGTNYIIGSLIVSVPYTGALASGITLTNPVAPSQVVSITFKAIVNTMPLPNPIVNIARVAYNYTVDPADPTGVSATATSNSFTTMIFRNDYLQQINDLIESVALQQAALAAIANAEGAKIQAAVAIGNITAQELLCINKSVEDMMASITILEGILKQKISVVDCQIEGTC